MATEPDGVEFLDVGPDPAYRGDDTGGDTRRPQRPDRTRLWWLLGLAAAVLGLIGFAVNRGPDGTPTAHVSPAPRTAGTAGTTTAQPSAAAQPVTVVTVGHPLLGITGTWQLIARGEDHVVRIEFGRGRVEITALPTLTSDGPVSLIVGVDSVLIRPTDYIPGYLVRDGEAPSALPRALSRGPVFPGPLPDQVWMPTGTDAVGAGDSVRVFGFDGRPEGQIFSLPGGVPSALLASDGAGGLTFSGVGGLYGLRPDGWHRLSPGNLLAVGPTRMLVQECDARYRCERVVVRQSDGARLAALPLRLGVGDAPGGAGTISPDGRTAALPFIDPTGLESIGLVDLRSGTERSTRLTLDAQADAAAGAMAWSPDGRWLFAVTNGGNIEALQVSSGRVLDLKVPLPTVVQLAVRAQGG